MFRGSEEDVISHVIRAVESSAKADVVKAVVLIIILLGMYYQKAQPLILTMKKIGVKQN